MVTRIHVRYAPDTFPEDLVFQETGDREKFQGRYVLRHGWKGSAEECSAASTLADLTGWPLADIRNKMQLSTTTKPEKWWERLWD